MKDRRQNKRKDRRYSGDVVKRADAAVETADGESFDGQLDDVSIAGAAIRFAANESPALKVGQLIIITLRVPLPTQTYHVADIQAEVRYLAADKNTGSLRCGLQFDHRAVRGSALYSALRALANRRREPRMKPEQEEELTMTLKTADGARVQGTVRDISANGARVLVGGEFETAAMGLDHIALSFQLPAEAHDTTLTGRIRNHQIDQDETYVGIEFDDEESPDFRSQQQEIVRYLMRRQREMIRK